ncbi:MAG TPA: AraC family transcriptional regulator [Prosthecobacter sp.]
MRPEKEQIHIPSGHSFRVLRWSRSLREVENILSPHHSERAKGEGTHWHFHVEMELTLFISGSGTRFVGDHIGDFTAGDLVLLGERLPHYWHTRQGSSGVSVQWHFPLGHAFWAFPETALLVELFQRAGRGLHLSGETATRISGWLQEMTQAENEDQLALLLRILACIRRAPEPDLAVLSSRALALVSESHYQQAIDKAVRYLVAHFREEVRLEEMLKLTHLSRPTFARQFKKLSGHTLSEFLNRLRLQAACRELVETDQSILEIALHCGFTQVSFFNRLFRRMTGCSPSAYRKKQMRG